MLSRLLLLWLALGLAGTVTFAEPLPVILDPSRAHDLDIMQSGPGVFSITTTGSDPYIQAALEPGAEPSGENFILSFEYFCPDGIKGFQVFYGPPIHEANSVSDIKLGRAEAWQPAVIDLKNLSGGKWNAGFKQFRLDFGSRPNIKIQVRNLQLRPLNAGEMLAAKQAEADREKKKAASESAARYINNASFPAEVTSVTADREAITIIGRAPVDGIGSYFLSEIKPHEEPWSIKDFTLSHSVDEAVFKITMPRFENNRDRLFSRWCLIRRNEQGVHELASHAVFPTEVENIATQDFPILKTRTKKGMGGVTFNEIASELIDLGVEHVTINIVLNSFLHPAPVKDGTEFAHEGVTYYISNGAIAGLDRTIKFYSQNKMIVSAIILIGFPSDPAERSAFNHPEARSPGIFAMPNLTTETGARTYQAALAYLAERYSKPENGLITHWILHNEVDYAWSWTNMGEQPMNIFMDHYVRSMRLAYYTARQFNPRARVFISLTHNWATPENSQGRNYVTRGMLDLLARYTKLEGDFEWGVAYHPYPESLFHAAAWKDKKATFSFDTEMITPKNIEVLDAYLHQPRFLYRGKQLRSVMLSEQGFHTMDYSEAAQKLQAAALIYTWHKIRPLKSIECFQNHRWIDALGEGGLLLGLRTLGAPNKPFGDKKLAWSVFQSLDTPQEAEASEFAKAIIGIQDFAEIPYHGEVK